MRKSGRIMPGKIPTRRWLCRRDAAAYGGVGLRTLDSWIRDGLVHAKLPTGTIRIHPDAVDAYLQRFQIGGTPAAVRQAADKILEGL